REAGIEVVAVCGRLALEPEALGRAGIARAYALADLEPDPAVSMAQAGPLLERAAESIARDFLS
ncbi:glycerate kinase, partial [Streptomyces sp. ZEA17I]